MKYSFVLLFLFAVGCMTEPKTSSGPSGSVSGSVFLYSDTGGRMPSNSGVTVTISGSDKTALTNDSGKWEIAGLAAGKYDLTFSKQGFGTMKYFGFETAGKDTVFEDEIDMSEPPKDAINFQRFSISISASDSTISYYMIAAMEPPFLQSRAVVLFLSTDSAALAKDRESASELISFVKSGSGYDGGFDWNSTAALGANNKAYPHGTKLYATVSISGEGPSGEYLSNYYDPTLGKQVYTALGEHSQILNGIVP